MCRTLHGHIHVFPVYIALYFFFPYARNNTDNWFKNIYITRGHLRRWDITDAYQLLVLYKLIPSAKGRQQGTEGTNRAERPHLGPLSLARRQGNQNAALRGGEVKKSFVVKSKDLAM